MSEEEKDKSPAGSSEGASDAGVSATDTEGKIVKIDQFLDVFEITKKDGAYEMNVNQYLLDQLRDEGITHEEYVKKIKSAQKFISNCYAEKADGKEMWNGISSGGETPTLIPSSGSDMEIAEFFYYMQTYNCYRNIARAFDVKEDEKGKLFFESREGASVDSLIKAGNSFLKLGWRPDSFYKEEVGGRYTSKPLTAREKNLVNSDFFTPMDIVLQTFDIETDEKGNAVSIKSKEDATEEDIGVGKIALKKLKWSEDLDEERVKDASGKEHYSVSCTPIFTENKVILEMLLAYKEKKNKEYAVIEGKGGNTATIKGGKADEVGDLSGVGEEDKQKSGKADEVGNVTGVGEEDKQKKGKLRVGTGYGEGSDIFADRVSEAKKLLSELMTPNSETMADFFIDLCVNVTAKIKDDMLLIYQP